MDNDETNILRTLEAEIAREHLGAFRKLMAAAQSRVPADATEQEVRDGILAALDEDPQLREQAERLAAFQQFIAARTEEGDEEGDQGA